MCLKCFFSRCFLLDDFFLWILSGCGSTCERFVDHFFFFVGKREYVKTSTACAREVDLQGWEGLGSV